eukprot:6231513-Ditylum_brightwellii.AAC.1
MLRWSQICAGTSQHILQDTQPIPHMQGQWTEHLWVRMAYINAEIKHKYKWVMLAQRENDHHIMDIFLNSPDIPVQALKTLHFTWYFMEATTLVEITTSNRKRIRPELFHPEQFINKEEMSHRHDPITWSRCSNIDKVTQRVWQDSIRATVCNHDRVLQRPLGKWLVKKDGNTGTSGNLYTSNSTKDGKSITWSTTQD